MATWQEIQQGIFAGESGGHYNALFGYQNRPGGRFEGVQVSEMSISDILDFTNPRGADGQYVKSARPDPEMGVATPVGAYQVVGSTLRDAVKKLGIDPSQKFDKATQDRIGKYIFETQGAKAFAGYKGPKMDGQQPTAQQMQQMQQQPRGLMGILRDPRTRQVLSSFSRTEYGKRLGEIAEQDFARQEELADLARAEEKEQKTVNRTIQVLQQKAKEGDQLAAMVLEGMQSGAIDPKTAMSLYMGKRLETPKTGETFTTMTGAQLNELQGTNLDPGKLYNVSSTGKVTQVGGGGVTIEGDKGVDKFAELDAKTLSETFSSGVTAVSNLNKINRLDALLQNVETGSMAALKGVMGNLGIETEGLGDIQAAQALINALVPAQRPPGSGPMSDADLELFKQSLPRIINSPGGNQIIINTMRGLAEYDAEGARIVQRLRKKEITQAEAFELLNSRADPFAAFKAPTGPAPTGV